MWILWTFGRPEEPDSFFVYKTIKYVLTHKGLLLRSMYIALHDIYLFRHPYLDES